MKHSPGAIDISYRHCRRFARRAGSNFYASFLLLPRDQRSAMEALYAFLRHVDDLADRGDSAAQSCNELGHWRELLNTMTTARPGSAADLPHDSAAAAILPALSDAVARFHIPVEHLAAVIDGVEMDIEGRSYETFEDLSPYCERVASAVGLACIHIWGFNGPAAFEPARQAGIAMQLTNILRDLREDAAAGRVYVPLADLRACGYSVEALKAGVADEAFHRLMAMEVQRAEHCYAAGRTLMPLLGRSGQRVFGLMMSTYHALLKAIARRPADVFVRRVRLSRAARLRLAARWLLWPTYVKSDDESTHSK